MTLLELLVAMSIFSVLGMTLAMFLNQGLKTWRLGESRRAGYEEAQSLIPLIRDDFRSTFAAAAAAPETAPRARFRCDLDPTGRQRVAFVRTIPAESRHPYAALAGNAVGGDRDLDGRDDRAEALTGRLRPTGGLMEVFYALDPAEDGVLLRSARSPIGGEESLFWQENFSDPARVRALARPISTRVIHFDVAFWTQVTETWDSAAPPLREPRAGVRSGPARVWDSTRAVPPPEGAPAPRPDEFSFFRGEASIGDPEDDIFPERVRVTLVLAEEGSAAIASALSGPLKADGSEARVFAARPFEGRGPFVRIGRGAAAEWVRVKSVDADGDVLRIDPASGRGLRGTRRRDHPAGADVVTGKTFTTEIEIPACAEDWNE